MQNPQKKAKALAELETLRENFPQIRKNLLKVAIDARPYAHEGMRAKLGNFTLERFGLALLHLAKHISDDEKPLAALPGSFSRTDSGTFSQTFRGALVVTDRQILAMGFGNAYANRPPPEQTETVMIADVTNIRQEWRGAAGSLEVKARGSGFVFLLSAKPDWAVKAIKAQQARPTQESGTPPTGDVPANQYGDGLAKFLNAFVLDPEMSKEADKESDQTPEKAAQPSVVSVADELGKFADLRDRGILSDEEFEQQKAKLLKSD